VFKGALAEGLMQLGRTADALAMIDEAIARGELSGGSMDQPELMRLKGRILLAISASNTDQVASLLPDAVEQSRRQSSPAWELRIAIDLARLTRTSPSIEGERILAAAFNRFVDGFETADLRAARLRLRTASR